MVRWTDERAGLWYIEVRFERRGLEGLVLMKIIKKEKPTEGRSESQRQARIYSRERERKKFIVSETTSERVFKRERACKRERERLRTRE